MLSEYNRKDNPLNKSSYWTEDKKELQRMAVLRTCKDEKKAYSKFHQKALHRVVAEKKLGRKLVKGEVVHHINGNKRDNREENLAVMTQAEHARLHRKGGGVNECSKK